MHNNIKNRSVIMKQPKCFFLIALIAISSCSVVRDHPKTVPASSSGSYRIQLKIKNEIDIIQSVRTTCTIIRVYSEWDVEKETTGNVWVRVMYNNMSAADCNKLLMLLDDIYGVNILEALPMN